MTLPNEAPHYTQMRDRGGLRTQGITKSGTDSEPLVSIITVVRNAESALERTVRSVIEQSFAHVEYIVIDGNSSDRSTEIIRRYETAIDYWVSEADRGIYDAMNKGISLSTGKLIGIIGAGDWYDPDVVAAAVETFLRTDADVIYGDVSLVDNKSGISEFRRSDARLMAKTMSSISHPSTFVKAGLYRDRAFDLELKIAADYDFFLRLFTSGCRFEHSGDPLTHILNGGASSSADTIFEVYRVHRKYYGKFYAFNEGISSMLRHGFFMARRKLLKGILPPAYFSSARAIWLRRRSKRAGQ